MAIVWSGMGELIASTAALEPRTKAAVAAVGQMLAPKIEAWAKANGPWTDRTGQARQGLTAISEAAADLVTVYLFHTADHGKWLEIANGGRYRVIIPALEAHYSEAMALIRSVIGR